MCKMMVTVIVMVISTATEMANRNGMSMQAAMVKAMAKMLPMMIGTVMAMRMKMRMGMDCEVEAAPSLSLSKCPVETKMKLS